MTEEPEYFNEEVENKPSAGAKLAKVIATLFVGGIYLVIFLKILFLK